MDMTDCFLPVARVPVNLSINKFRTDINFVVPTHSCVTNHVADWHRTANRPPVALAAPGNSILKMKVRRSLIITTVREESQAQRLDQALERTKN